MDLPALLKFALICFDALAWPLFALGYPLRASIQAIEANSNANTKKLVTYWVIFSLISLFEHAFMGILQWLPFWPYMKLAIVCWMMIPDFNGAFYVYNHFVHPCLCMDVQTIIIWLRKQLGFFFLKDNFLSRADDLYARAHELTEALDKLIADQSRDTEPSILQKDIKLVQVTEKREVAPVNPIPETAPNAAQTVNNTILSEIEQTVNNTIKLPEIEGTAGFGPPEITSDNQVQKEWTCAMCQVTTTSEKTLNIHLQGRRHRNACADLMKAKNSPSKGKVAAASVDRVKQSDRPHKEPQKDASSTSNQASQKRQRQRHPKDQASASSVAENDLPSNNTSTFSKGVNPETETSKSHLPKDKSNKSLPTKMEGNQLKPSENVEGQQPVENTHAETKIPQFRCTICNISCGRSEDLNCHLWGRKHLARIQQLNRLGIGELA